MKATNYFMRKALLLLASVFCLSYANARGKNTDETEKLTITRTYDVSEGFNAVFYELVGSVTFVQTKDKTSTLKIIAPEDYLNTIEVTVKNGTLKMTSKTRKMNGDLNRKGVKAIISITSPTLTGISTSGVGDFNILAGLITPELSVKSDGVGNINIQDLECDKLIAVSQGVGNLNLSGTATEAELKSEGVGNIKAENLKVGELTVYCTGIGNITCYATESITAVASGVGSIRYKGVPTVKMSKKSGVGTIKPL